MTDPDKLFLQSAYLESGKLIFDETSGFDKALKDGCFYLAIPNEADLQPCIDLARNFHLEKEDGNSLNRYRGFKSLDGIYFDREHFQTEHILLDQFKQRIHLPQEVLQSYGVLSSLAQICLCNVLEFLGVPRKHWTKATGGATDGNGTHWFALSHYRHQRAQLGCAPHQDTGFVTVLYIEQDGLEAMTSNGWRAINARKGYFVVNFGASFEHLTAVWKRPVHGIYHRVKRTFRNAGEEDRFSFAAFANPPASGLQYQIQASGIPKSTGSVEAFLRDFNETTWKDKHHDFGVQ